MDVLFNRDGNGTAEIKQFLPVNQSQNFDTIKPYIREATKVVVDDALGPDFYKEITDNYFGDQSKTHLNDVVPYIQNAVTNLAYYLGFDILILKWGDSGVYRQSKENYEAPFLRQEKNAKAKLQRMGYNLIDELLEFLENNADKYTTWENSEYATINKKHLVYSTRIWDQVYSIRKSRLIFIEGLRYQKMVEKKHIIPFISRNLFDRLITNINNNNVSDKERELIDVLQYAIVFFSIAEGDTEFISKILQKYIGDGLEISDEYQVQTVEPKYLREMKNKMEQNGKSYLKMAESFMKKNIEEFPEFKEYGSYIDGNSSLNTRGMSSDKLGVF